MLPCNPMPPSVDGGERIGGGIAGGKESGLPYYPCFWFPDTLVLSLPWALNPHPGEGDGKQAERERRRTNLDTTTGSYFPI